MGLKVNFEPCVDVHTNPFSYASVFDPTKTDTNIRVHTSVFESFSTVHTSYEKTIRFRFPWETDYRVHDVSVFGVFARSLIVTDKYFIRRVTRTVYYFDQRRRKQPGRISKRGTFNLVGEAV